MKRTRIVLNILFLSMISSEVYSYFENKTYCVAHRGYNKENIENSMKSFESAIEMETDGIEFDIQMTRDGIPIVMHDQYLKRVTQNQVDGACLLDTKIRDLDFKFIRDNCELKNGEMIPSLEEVLLYLEDKDIFVFIELKSRPNKLTLDLIKKYFLNNPDKVRVISFKKSYLRPIVKMSRIDPFWADIKILKVSYSFPSLIKKVGVNLHFSAMGALLVPQLQGRETGVWTVNDRKILKSAKHLGVKFVTTDRPEICKQIMNEI